MRKAILVDVKVSNKIGGRSIILFFRSCMVYDDFIANIDKYVGTLHPQFSLCINPVCASAKRLEAVSQVRVESGLEAYYSKYYLRVVCVSDCTFTRISFRFQSFGNHLHSKLFLKLMKSNCFYTKCKINHPKVNIY